MLEVVGFEFVGLIDGFNVGGFFFFLIVKLEFW